MRVLGGRRSVSAAFVVGLIGCGLLGVGGSASAGPDDELGYPTMIGTDRDPDDLPDVPGRMSGSFVGLGLPTSMASAMTGTAFLVSETGRVYRLPQAQKVIGYGPTLSPDGSRVAYFPDPDAFVIRDLVSGETTRFSDIPFGDAGADSSYEFDGSDQWWSPDGTRLLLFTGSTIVLSLDGTITEAPRPRGAWAFPAGWIGDEIAWIRWRGPSAPDRPESGELVVAPVAGGPGRTIQLEDVAALNEVGKAGTAISPDGSSLAVVTPDGEESGRFTLYSTADGSVISRSTVDHALNTNCPIAWASGEPAVAAGVQVSDIDGSGSTGSDALLAMSGKTLVRSTDQFAPCSIWAADALSGPGDPDSAAAVESSSSSSAYAVDAWVVIVAVLGVAGGAAATGWFLVRRRRRAG